MYELCASILFKVFKNLPDDSLNWPSDYSCVGTLVNTTKEFQVASTNFFLENQIFKPFLPLGENLNDRNDTSIE